MNRSLRILIALGLAALATVIAASLISYAPDQIVGASPAGANYLGPAGARIAHHLVGSWGVVAFYFPLALLGFAFALARDSELAHLARRLTGAVLLVPALAGLMHLLPLGRYGERLLLHWDQLQLGGLGGNVGYLLCGAAASPADPTYPGGLLVRHLDSGGSALVLGAVAVACTTLMEIGLVSLALRAWRALRSYPSAPAVPEPTRRNTPPFVPSNQPAPTPVPKSRTTTVIKEITKRIAKVEPPVPADAADLVERIRERRRALERQASGEFEVPADPDTDDGDDGVPDPEEHAAAAAATGGEAPPRNQSAADVGRALRAATSGVPLPAMAPSVSNNPDEPVRAAVAKPPAKPKKRLKGEDSGYHLPPVNLLDEVPERRQTESELEKTAIARAIEDVFSHFEISVRVVAASRGPVITMYEIQLLDQAMRVNKVEGFEKDLSLKLGTEGIRIVAPLPNKKTIGIEVPNRIKEQVVMRDLVEQIDASAMTLPLILGRDVVGNPMVGDLARMPHLLVAGATGTGKSVCMNAMICSVLLFRGPEEVKFIMVDPKMVELAGYEDIPHLLAPPITDMTKAHAALEWACRTMDERYFALRLVGVRDIKAYNDMGEAEIRVRLAKKGKTLEELPGMSVKMSYIIVLVDEYADLMMVNKEVEKSIIRLCQKSRAAGIHVILTTQRPSADVVTGLIKSNLPARICFRVADKNNSRVVLDAGGAENLLGRGDMLFLPPGSNTLVRGQGVWVKDKEIEAIIEHAKSQGEPQYDETILSAGSVAMVGGGGSGEAKSSDWIGDRQFHEAVQSMYRYNRSGADFFRRKLNIGYNKATAYVEQLEDLGFLGPQKATASREIIKSWDDWIELLKANGVTWDEDDELYHNPMQIGAGG